MATKTTQMRRKNPFQGIALYGYTLIGHIESCGSKSLKIPKVAAAVRHIAEPGNEKNLDRLHMHLGVRTRNGKYSVKGILRYSEFRNIPSRGSKLAPRLRFFGPRTRNIKA